MKPLSKSELRNRRSNFIRQRIVEAARAHFFSHGFRRVTMDDLAEELGISKKTLYAHFPGKLVWVAGPIQVVGTSVFSAVMLTGFAEPAVS